MKNFLNITSTTIFERKIMEKKIKMQKKLAMGQKTKTTGKAYKSGGSVKMGDRAPKSFKGMKAGKKGC